MKQPFSEDFSSEHQISPETVSGQIHHQIQVIIFAHHNEEEKEEKHC